MPLTLNVGLTKKVGEPNYGSRGASVNVATELDATLVGRPDELRDRIRHLFSVARDAVQEELSGTGNGQPSTNGQPTNGQHANGIRPASQAERAATASQVRAIRAIADRNQIDLAAMLKERFKLQSAAELSLKDASRLIDELKSRNGSGGRA